MEVCLLEDIMKLIVASCDLISVALLASSYKGGNVVWSWVSHANFREVERADFGDAAQVGIALALMKSEVSSLVSVVPGMWSVPEGSPGDQLALIERVASRLRCYTYSYGTTQVESRVDRIIGKLDKRMLESLSVAGTIDNRECPALIRDFLLTSLPRLKSLTFEVHASHLNEFLQALSTAELPQLQQLRLVAFCNSATYDTSVAFGDKADLLKYVVKRYSASLRRLHIEFDLVEYGAFESVPLFETLFEHNLLRDPELWCQISTLCKDALGIPLSALRLNSGSVFYALAPRFAFADPHHYLPLWKECWPRTHGELLSADEVRLRAEDLVMCLERLDSVMSEEILIWIRELTRELVQDALPVGALESSISFSGALAPLARLCVLIADYSIHQNLEESIVREDMQRVKLCIEADPLNWRWVILAQRVQVGHKILDEPLEWTSKFLDPNVVLHPNCTACLRRGCRRSIGIAHCRGGMTLFQYLLEKAQSFYHCVTTLVKLLELPQCSKISFVLTPHTFEFVTRFAPLRDAVALACANWKKAFLSKPLLSYVFSVPNAWVPKLRELLCAASGHSPYTMPPDMEQEASDELWKFVLQSEDSELNLHRDGRAVLASFAAVPPWIVALAEGDATEYERLGCTSSFSAMQTVLQGLLRIKQSGGTTALSK